MQPINTLSEFTPFAGKVVAYKTDSSYFGASKGYVLEEESTCFGYIEEHVSRWASGETGYNMSRLLKAKELSALCALILSKMESPLSMRLATTHEINQISKAICADQAYFEYIFTKEKMQRVLAPQLSKL